MASGASYYDDLRSKPEVIDPPQNKDTLDVGEHVKESGQTAIKPDVTVSSSVRELLECPVCLNAMYPPIHQVQQSSIWYLKYEICDIGFFVIFLYLCQ